MVAFDTSIDVGDDVLGSSVAGPVKPVAGKTIATKFVQAIMLVDSSGDEILAFGPSLVTFTPTRPALPDNASTTLIAANASRVVGSYAVNNTGATIWLQYGAAAVLNQGVEWIPGQVFKFDTTQEIRGIQNSGGSVNPDFFEAT